MRRSLIAVGLVLGLAGVGTATATSAVAAPEARYLKCFTSGGGTCSKSGSSYRLTVVNNGVDAAGVYDREKGLAGKKLSDVNISFTYSGTISGGAPRITAPVDFDADGDTDSYVSVGATRCPGGNSNPTAGTVGTSVEGCLIDLNQPPPDDQGSYASWGDLVAAHTSWRIATDNYAFIITDWSSDVVVSNIDLR